MKKIAFAGALVVAAAAFAGTNSGLSKGERVSPFHPSHIMGPLANTSNCFPCTFQNRPQVQIWVNGESAENVKGFAKVLDGQMAKFKNKEFKAMIVVLTKPGNEANAKKETAMMLKPLNLKNVDVSILATNDEAVENYKINTASTVKNTIFAYKNWEVQDKWVNVNADAKGVSALTSAVENLVK